ncbi:MAG: PHP domain-containing protein [Planctomycetota bacterium]
MSDAPAAAPFCDLHLHSTASDGADAPGDLPRLCRDAGLSCFALTDHDTTAGVDACAAAARRLKIDFIPGVELSANPALDGGEPRGTLHLLGHFVDPDHPRLAEVSARMRQTRAERNPAIVAKLNDLGVRITNDDLAEAAGRSGSTGSDDAPGRAEETSGGGMIGRPHIAQVLIEKGYVRTMHEAFTKYLGRRGAAYVRRDTLDAAEAIDVIHAAGGVVSLAHPVQLGLDDDALEHAVARLDAMGLDGIETRHSDHTPADVRKFGTLAERFGLLTTGGSDYHGSRKTVALNSQRVPRAVADRLRDAASRVATRASAV